jgi:hypothetical protein
MCVRVSVQFLSEIFYILRRTERDVMENVYWPPCKVHFILSDFNETLIFLPVFRKILKHHFS